MGSHLHYSEVAKHLDVWPPHHQSHCHLCIGAVGLRRQWSSAWWKHQGVGLFVCKEPEENCWLSYKVLRIGGRVQATNKNHTSWELSKMSYQIPTSITSTFHKFSKQPLKSWVWKSPNYHQKKTFLSKNSLSKIQGLAWRTSCGSKAQDSSEGCPCGTWSYQQGSVGIDWSCMPLPLGGHDTCGDVGTIDEENRILMAHYFKDCWLKVIKIRWKIDEDMETELSVGFVEDWEDVL